MKYEKDAFGSRMKKYESVTKTRLIPKTPVLMRLDGKAFHTLTKGMKKPYDRDFQEAMRSAALYLCKEIHGAKIAYVQSDEIQILITDFQSMQTQGWFDYEVQKMCSVAAGMCSVAFYQAFIGWKTIEQVEPSCTPCFDARVWNLPEHEVVNAFIWRQQDATRNAIQCMGQAHFSHKQLQGKNCNKIQDMLFSEKGINFNDLPVEQKRGTCTILVKKEQTIPDKEGGLTVTRSRWETDYNIPIFSKDRDYINKLLKVEPNED